MTERLLLVLSLLTGCSDVTSPRDYVDLIESSRGCSSDEQCVVAGGSACTCSAPVNASNEQDIDEAASQVECNEATADCPEHTNVLCEAGRCISDESP